MASERIKDVLGFQGAGQIGRPVVVISAHPDDEVIGLGARLPRLRTGWFVQVTDGAPVDGRDAKANGFASIEDYARARRNELIQALRLGGVEPVRTRHLGVPDQQASLQLSGLTLSIIRLLEKLQPGLIVTHPYEGGHPDHDATAFAIHAACRVLQQDAGSAPEIIEMACYHLGPAGIEVGCFLPVESCTTSTFVLSPEERQFKARLLACFKTQRETLKYFPPGMERFRRAPCYDFTVPPHPGKVFYDFYDWGMTSSRFGVLAASAMAELGLEGKL